MSPPRAFAATTFALAGLLSFAAPAVAATPTVLRARDGLTQRDSLQGSMSFASPRRWRETAASGVYSARFVAPEGERCAADLHISIRGKATRQSADQQARAAVGDSALAAGRRVGGVYRLGEFPSAEGAHRILYGIAVLRIARRRFGQLRIFAFFSGLDCTSETVSQGEVASAAILVLRNAASRLRIKRTAARSRTASRSH